MSCRIVFLTILITLLPACSPAEARALVEVEVIDRERDEWLLPVRHRGQDWIAGEPGHRYAVRLTNTSGSRVLVVLSIDGINAVTGETAHPSQAGYVLDPWQSTQIDGWRKSLDDVAQFVFTDLADSYATRTGRPSNVGVIGVAVFDEARPMAYDAPSPVHGPRADTSSERARRAASADVAEEEPSRQNLGTGHGERQWSPVSHTGFIRRTHIPAQVTQFRYDDRPSLIARGVWPRPHHHRHTPPPQAFPPGFVPDPPMR